MDRLEFREASLAAGIPDSSFKENTEPDDKILGTRIS